LKFFNVKVTELATNKVKTNVKIPLFVVVTAGRHTPELVFKFLLKRTNAPENDSKSFKDIVKTIVDILKSAAEDDNLNKYNGLIADIEDNGEKIEISIK